MNQTGFISRCVPSFSPSLSVVTRSCESKTHRVSFVFSLVLLTFFRARSRYSQSYAFARLGYGAAQVGGYRHFGTTYRSLIQKSGSPRRIFEDQTGQSSWIA